MYLKHLLKIRKTVGFRLTAWYSGIFILSSLLLFVMGYFFLSSALRRQDRKTTVLELGKLSAKYKRGGMSSLEKELKIEKKIRKKNPLFIRIAGAKNNTLSIFLPYQWAEFDLNKLETTIPHDNRKWIRLPAIDDEYVLEVASTRLPDGHWLQVGMSTENRETVLERFRETFAAIMIPLVLLGFIAGFFLSFRALRPIRQLIETVQSLDIGKLEARVPSPRTGDELDELVRLFNGMMEKIKTLISAMKGSLDNVAHDFRTPMTRFRGMAEMALRVDQDADVCREALADCIEESDHILKMLNTLMDISEAETGVMNLDRKVVDISGLMDEVVDLYRYVAEEKGLPIHMSVPNGLSVTVDPNRMSQALANLLDNAIKYTPAGGQISVEAYKLQGEVVVRVKDTGTGISHEELPMIWDRLYRADLNHSLKGLGLGLSQVKAIIQAHNGRVDVVSEPTKGSIFSIYLPADL
ncbi:MAG: HAMP domain-containing histidine kinase [Desulfobacterales bacterium]|nr:HAMP domain-containing histidine kinase [Desulfobacterales bacterium]